MNDKILKWKIGWGVTHQCNMRCSFCYSRIARNETKDISFLEAKEFLDRNSPYINSINYGTGENTLSDVWFELSYYIHQNYKHIKQALTTNGYLGPSLTKSVNRNFILDVLDEVDVSLDYHDPKLHNRSRGHPLAFDWALQTINLCKSANIVTTLVILGIDETLTIKNLSKILLLAKENQCYVRINIFRPNANQGLKPLSYEGLKKALNFLVNNCSIVSLSDPLFSAITLGKKVCDASGSTSLRILPDGYITPSTYLVTPEWKRIHVNEAFLDDNLFCDALGKGISDNILPASCFCCELKETCGGGAIDRRIIWYDTMTEADPYCPYRYQDTLDSWAVPSVKMVEGPKVHDGYLPTLIFAP